MSAFRFSGGGLEGFGDFGGLHGLRLDDNRLIDNWLIDNWLVGDGDS